MAIAEDLQQDIVAWITENKSKPLFRDELDEEQVYSYGVPRNVNGNKLNKIIILIREISLQPKLYGSNQAQEEVATAQIQFFYPKESDISSLHDDDGKPIYYDYYRDIEKPILNYLHEKRGWSRTIGGGHDLDPDTEQIYSTYHIHTSINYLQENYL